ncbi:hypothetical protein K456DRAFT_39806 [Colletotrichum gloeosporioides 23]|nr:hypothetical protein K456DRAFT_39806 [Colletotrichum gloeosporioides 23]
MRQSFFLAQPPTGATQSWQSPGNGNAILPVTRPGRTLPYGYTLRCFCSSAPPAELMVLSPTRRRRRRRRRRSAQRRRKTQAALHPRHMGATACTGTSTMYLIKGAVTGQSKIPLLPSHTFPAGVAVCMENKGDDEAWLRPISSISSGQRQPRPPAAVLAFWIGSIRPRSVAQLALAPHLSPHPSSLPGLPQYCLRYLVTECRPVRTERGRRCCAAVVMQQQQQQQQLLPAAVDVAAAAPLGIGLLLPPAPALAVFVSHLPFPIFCICGNIKRGRNRNSSSSSDRHLTLTISLYATMGFFHFHSSLPPEAQAPFRRCTSLPFIPAFLSAICANTQPQPSQPRCPRHLCPLRQRAPSDQATAGFPAVPLVPLVPLSHPHGPHGLSRSSSVSSYAYGDAFRDKGRFAPSAPLVAVAATAPLPIPPLPHHLASFASRRPLDP